MAAAKLIASGNYFHSIRFLGTTALLMGEHPAALCVHDRYPVRVYVLYVHR